MIVIIARLLREPRLGRAQSVRAHVTHAPSRLCARRPRCVTCSQDFRLSSVNSLWYICARTACSIPTPSSARRIDLGRVGDDL
jgi:hypothetical protein